MAPASAEDVANYRLNPISGRRLGPAIPIKAAVYDPVTHTVTLRTVNPVYLYDQYQLTVIGTPPSGVSNTSGQFLQGQGSGHPGTNYVTTFGESILAGPNMTSSMSRATRARIRKTWRHELAYAARVASRIAKAAHRRTEGAGTARRVSHAVAVSGHQVARPAAVSAGHDPHAPAVDAVIGSIVASRKGHRPGT